jgi:hypothetical protein
MHYDTLFLKKMQTAVNLFQLLVLVFVFPRKNHKKPTGFFILSSDRLTRNLLVKNSLLVVAEPSRSHAVLLGLSKYNRLFSIYLSFSYVQIQFTVL